MIWHEHVSSIATAAGKKLGYLFRARKYFSPCNLLTLYKAQIRPNLEYCSHIWGAAAPTTLSILDAVQRRAIRLIGDPALTCHLQPLSHRRAEHPKELCINNTTICAFCDGEHSTIDRQCPEYKRQRAIKEVMAFENISYFEARAKCPKNYTPNNQTQTNTTNSLFSRNSQDFPAISPRTPVRQNYEIAERTTTPNRWRSTPHTYSYTLKSPKRKPNTQTNDYATIGKKLIREASFPDTCRLPQTSTTNIYEQMENIRSQQAPGNLSQFIKDIIKETSLPETSKEEVYQKVDSYINTVSIEAEIEQRCSPITMMTSPESQGEAGEPEEY
nr:unnamed protein product [Callosobruchus chinensis]